MLRDGGYKFIACAGTREREDGYKTGDPPGGRMRRLYDLQADPAENLDLAGDAAQSGRIARMEQTLAERLRARYFLNVPKFASAADALDWLASPRDDARRPPR